MLETQHLQQLLGVLRERGYWLLGPTAGEGAIVYEEVRSVDDLPRGWTDEQRGGHYRLQRRQDEALFGYALGPHSWKNFLHPPGYRFLKAKRTGRSFQLPEENAQTRKYAFIGARSCDLYAIAILDKIFLGGPYVDFTYKARRDSTFIVAINCSQAGGTCFCVSMQTGPKATFGFDMGLTEVLQDGRHFYLVEPGTPLGAEVLQQIPHQLASPQDEQAAERVIALTAAQMGRAMDTTDIKELLYRNYEHPRWENVAARCLTCGNCTMVCPTCFCTTVEDVTDLSGQHAERWRKWDSCFTMDFSYLHGGSVRATPKSRYRQWMTHKLATWIDQFGASGCVGCGRCITWCPVGIDITEEVRAIRETEAARSQHAEEKDPYDHTHT